MVTEGFKGGPVGGYQVALQIEFKDRDGKEIDQFPVFLLAFPQHVALLAEETITELMVSLFALLMRGKGFLEFGNALPQEG